MFEDIALRRAGVMPPKSKKKTPRDERVRHKDWLADGLDDPDVYYDRDIAVEERIVPKGEAERKKAQPTLPPLATVEAAPPVDRAGDLSTVAAVGGRPAADPLAVASAAHTAGTSPAANFAGTTRAVVIEVSTGLCRVQLDGRPLLCEVRRSVRAAQDGYTNAVAVGDEVVVSRNGGERGYVEAVLPRRSALARPDVFYPHLQQVIVANADQLLIVAAWLEPPFWPELVDRYLIAAARYNLAPIICVNKVDLAAGPAEPREEGGETPPLRADPVTPRERLQPYIELGVRVLFTSAATGEGVDELREVLRGRTTALAGLSGVGKSSLLSAAEPGLELKVGEVNHQRQFGRHTTTQVTMHPLVAGGFVVDTPGIREFGLSGMAQRDLLRYYPDLGFVGQGCRFEDCAHVDESGCAVRAAVRSGKWPAMRYDSYLKILRALPA